MRSATTTVAVTAAIALSGCGSGDREQPPAGTTASSPAGSVPSPTSPTGPPTGSPAADVRVISVSVAGGEVTRESRRVELRRGEKVRIEVTADVSDEVHLHTYDVKSAVAPGRPAVLEFTATIPGQFEVELEGSHLLLVVVAVR